MRTRLAEVFYLIVLPRSKQEFTLGNASPTLVLPDQHGQPVGLHKARAGHKDLVICPCLTRM
jgi:hypothetical protein